MWAAALGLAVSLVAGKVSLTATETPLPEAMKALAAQLGGRLEMEGDFSDLRLTLRLENAPPAEAVRQITDGWPIDYYVRGAGEVIILQRRGTARGPRVVYQPAPADPTVEAQVDHAMDFISRLGELTPEEKKRLRGELLRNW